MNRSQQPPLFRLPPAGPDPAPAPVPCGRRGQHLLASMLAMALLIGSGAMSLAQEDESKPTQQDLVARSQIALKAFGSGKWAEAKVLYEAILKKYPGNVEAFANLGAIEFQLGEMKAARKHLEIAVADKPGLSQSWVYLGLIYYSTGEMNLALSALSRALHENPKNPMAHNYMAVVIKERGWMTGAEKELLKAIELKPDYADAHFNLALMYLERKPASTALAKRHYDKAIELGAEKDEIVEKLLKK